MNQKYDLICVFKPSLPEEKIDGFVSKLEKKVVSAGGSFEKVTKHGIKKVQTLLRKFKKIKDGYFLEINLSCGPETPEEVFSLLKVNEDIMRYILTKEIVQKPKEVEKTSEEAVEINPEMLIGKPE